MQLHQILAQLKMSKKVYDVANILYLYEKYKTIADTAMRSGYSTGTVKKILVENGVELKKYIPPRWNIKRAIR